MSNYKVFVYKRTEQDNYQHGCDPETFREFGCIATDVVAESQLKEYFDLYGDNPVISENMVEVDRLENDKGEMAGIFEREQFDRGEIDLWCATYTFICYKLESVNHKDLRKLFSKIEI